VLEAPPTMVAGEFLKDVIDGLKLAPGEWVAYDKDTGRTLDPTRTLAANGVDAGHHLYLQRPSNVPVQRPPEPPPPHRWAWVKSLAWVLLVLLVGLWIGYILGREKAASSDESRNREPGVTTQPAEVVRLRTQIEELQAKLQAASVAPAPGDTAAVAELKSNLDQQQRDAIKWRKEAAAARKELQDLKARPPATSSPQSPSVDAQLAEARHRAELFERETLKLQKVVQEAEMQSNTATIRAEQLEKQLKSRGQFGIIRWSGTASKDRPIVIDGSNVKEGRLLTAGLPGVRCRVLATDPDRIEIRARPGEQNGWRQLSFVSKDGRAGSAEFVWFAQ
jgi:hypothetical protein